MSKPTGHGFELVVVTPSVRKGVYQDPYPMLLHNGTPVGLVTNFKMEVDPTGKTMQMSFSTRLGMNRVHGMTSNQFDSWLARTEFMKKAKKKQS